MSLTIKDTSHDFLPAPEGLHIARCYALIDLGIQLNKSYGSSHPKIVISWELDKKMDDGQPFIHSQQYTASLSEKSNLRGLLEAWRGKSFTAEELKGFKLANFLNAYCYLTIKHKSNPQTNKQWAEVSSICRLPEGVSYPPAHNPIIYFDLDNYSDDAFCKVPEGFRKRINLSGINLPPTLSPTPTLNHHEKPIF